MKGTTFAREAWLIACSLCLVVAAASAQDDDPLRIEFAGTYSAVEATSVSAAATADTTVLDLGGRPEPSGVPGVVELRFTDQDDTSVVAEAAAAADHDTYWERAHRVSIESSEFALVVPDFEVDLPQYETLRSSEECPPCPPRAVTGYPDDGDPIPGALNEPEWHLDAQHGANILAAWARFGEGNAGAGIVIGHPDTGYTEHPELMVGPRGAGGVDAMSGYDFLDGDEDRDPQDPLQSGLLRFPSHGTKTGSVIVSARGSQLEAATTWVSGVAPASTLIPLRVTEGVVLAPRDLGRLRVDVTRLAEAIAAASGADRSKVKKKADIISISLGGLPNERLKRAIRDAEKSDVIVVAAAGNYSRRFVVFPSAYATVVSVAASNYANEPWKKSAYGSQVAITAPGESVWSAVSHPHPQYCLSASDGTSFATAVTAGVAALWLSNPERAAMIEELTNAKRRAATFRRAVAAGFRRVDDWNTKRYGPGILDAVKVLEFEAPAPESGVAFESELTSWCEGDYEGAYDELRAILRDVDDPRARVETLLDDPDLCSCDADRCNPSLANEIAFIYAVDEDVAEAFEDLNAAASPTTSDYQRIRDTILERRISPQLRTALQ